MNQTDNETALELIESACKLMGWGIVLTGDEDSVHYMVIGTTEGIQTALARLNGELN